MTFDDIVDAIMQQCNHTSTDAETRIGESVNRVYKRVTTEIGLNLTKRNIVSATTAVNVSSITFSNIEKIINVVDRSVTPWRTLTQETLDTLQRRQPFQSTTPRAWAEEIFTANTVTVLLDCIPEEVFTLYADGYVVKPTLSGENEPTFPESFHEILYYGVLADEYRKMKQPSLAKDAASDYDKILSGLKFFINKQSALDVMQGKHRNMPMMASGGGSGSGSGSGLSGSGTENHYAKWSGTTELASGTLQEVGGALFWQDSSNANNTSGLTLNQLTADDHALTLKSSDVATGVTSGLVSAGGFSAETDDYFTIQKRNATLGGVQLTGLMENASTDRSFVINAIGGQASTSKSSGATGLVDMYIAQHDGSNGVANVEADGNIVCFAAQVGGARVARWLVDEDGDTWQAGGATFNNAVYINDTLNANNTAGLTLNQLATDDHVITLKSSDVATGLTSVPAAAVETDDFASFSKNSATGGGLRIQALGENAANQSNLFFVSHGGQAETTKSTSGQSLISFYAAQHDGNNTIQNITANGNVFGIIARVGGANVTVMIVDEDGDVWLSGGLSSASPLTGIGYTTGAGGTVTQLTNKATGVSLNAASGQITMNNAALNAGVIVSFVLTDTAIAAGDVLVLNHISGGTPGSYGLNARCAAGSATIDVRNNTAGNLSEAIVIAFALIKAVTA